MSVFNPGVRYGDILSTEKRQVRSPVHQQSISFTLKGTPVKDSMRPAMNPSS